MGKIPVPQDGDECVVDRVETQRTRYPDVLSAVANFSDFFPRGMMTMNAIDRLFAVERMSRMVLMQKDAHEGV